MILIEYSHSYILAPSHGSLLGYMPFPKGGNTLTPINWRQQPHFNPINDQQNTCKVFYTALNFDSAADDADITITK